MRTVILCLPGVYRSVAYLTSAGTLAFLAIGLLAGAVAKTAEAASAIANLVVLPMAFLSGAFFPLENSPGRLKLLPLKHLAIGILLGFTVVVTGAAALLFQWDDI
jgi:ABC-2 type transport system permease protein